MMLPTRACCSELRLEVNKDPFERVIYIRPMSLEDLEQVREIDQASFTMPWPESAYRFELQKNPASLLWVAETRLPGEKSNVVGMIVVWLILDEAHIATLAVHPDFRRHGIGKRLLATALHQSIRKRVKEAMLEVRASNQAAERLYRGFGFEIVGHRKRYYQDNQEDAVLMTLRELGSNYLAWLQLQFGLEISSLSG